MKKILTAAGLGVVAVALGSGPAFAGCHQGGDPYPTSEGWTAVDLTVTVPKGYACNVAVQLHYVGHERSTALNAQKTKFLNESPDEVVTATNVKTGKRITRKITGTVTETVSGHTVRLVGRGKNIYYGPGVFGILWAHGTQRLTVTNADNAKVRLHVTATKGRTRELCDALGARAVAGKVLPEPEAPAA